MSVKSILGLADEGAAEWPRLRGLSTGEIAKLTFNRGYAHAALALFVAQIFLAPVGIVWVAMWFSVLLAVQIRLALLDRRMVNNPPARGAKTYSRRQSVNYTMSAIVWAVPLLIFAPMGSASDATALLVVTVILVAATVFFYITAPRNILIYIGVLGTAAALSYAMAGDWFVVGAIALFMILSVFAPN